MNIRLLTNNKFSSKVLLNYGICLGSHKGILQPTTSSVVFGLRTQIAVINLNLTLIELVKVSKLIEGLGFQKSVLYYINNIISFRQSMFAFFNTYNKHLFFPFKVIILNVFRRIKTFFLKKKITKRLRLNLKKKTLFLLKTGKSLLRKVFVASRWSYGFVSNSRSFFAFVNNVLHHKVQVGKMISKYQDKVKAMMDYYPFLPHYGFIGDHRLNYWVVNEFKAARVANSSVVDTLSAKAFHAVYAIPGSCCAIDSSLFFLIILITYYLIGFYQQIFRFIFVKQFQELEFTHYIKEIFFKNFRKLDFLKKHHKFNNKKKK